MTTHSAARRRATRAHPEPGLGATVRAAGADAFAVLVRAGRLLFRHWPVLLAILLAGEAGRYAALWAAVEVSAISGTLGLLVLVLGPLAAVAALIAALYALRHSLPSLDVAAADGASDGTPTGMLGALGSVMVPFLAIYASYGYLDEDTFRFVNAAVTDELYDVDVLLGTEAYDADRTALATGWVAMAVVALAIVLRYGIEVVLSRRRVRGLVWLAAYVEVLWLVTLARMLAARYEEMAAWMEDLTVVRSVVRLWESAIAFAGPIGTVVDTVSRWFLDLLGSADALVVIPVAWLTVGVVVYGRQLREPQRRVPTHRRAPQPRLPARMRAPVELAGDQVTGGLGDRFGELAAGLRRLALAGLAPMLLFVLAFVIAQRLEHLVNLLIREVLGPMELGTYLAFAPHLDMLAHVVGTVVVVCLLGAAIDRVLDREVAATGPVTPDRR